MTLPRVFVINLKRSEGRRQDMAQRLGALNIPHEFFDAVDGHALDLDNTPAYDRLWRRLFFGRDLRKGEIGCLLSHRAVYQHMVDHNVESALILEDDVFFKPEFPQVLTALMGQPLHWDMIRFLDSEKVYQKSRFIRALGVGDYSLKRVLIASGGAYAYLLTQKAARVLLKHMQKNALPVDILHGYVWRTGLEVFAVVPSPVSPDIQIDSTIGSVRFDKTLEVSGWQKVAYPFTRSWLKFSELVGKRLAYWSAWKRDRALR